MSSISYEIPTAIEESSILEPLTEEEMIDEEPPTVTFEVVENCSERGQKKLFDSRGYCYTVKRRRGTATDWTCTIHGKNNRCSGSVVQDENKFHIRLDHNHAGELVFLPQPRLSRR